MEMTVKIENPGPGGDEENQGWVVVNVKVVLGLLGAAAALGWFAITLMAGPLGVQDTEIEFQSAIAHLAFLAGIIVAVVMAVPLADFWSSHRAMYLAISAVLIAAGFLLANCFEEVRLALWIGFAAGGVGAGILYTLYGEYLSAFFSNGIEPYTHTVMLMAAVLVAGYFFVSIDYRIPYWIAVAVVAFAGYLSQMAFYKVHTMPYTGWKESRPRARVQRRSYLSTTTSGIMLGFALGATFTIGSSGQTAYLIAALVVAAVCGFLLYDSLHKRVLDESVSMHWFLPAAAVLAFPMLFVPPSIAFVFAVLMACFAVLPTSCSISAICRHIHICDLSAIGQFGFGRFWGLLGILIGVGVGFIGFSQQIELVFGHYGITAAICVFMILVIASCSFFMVEDNYPSEERIRVVEDESGGKTVTVGPGTPIHALNVPEARASEGEERRVGTFQLKCDIVAEKYGLSKRQTEVLGMLARGRGAEYITEKLVISPHTAKAHTYNIYLKLDVHSRQELMDLVENTVVPEEAIEEASRRLT